MAEAIDLGHLYWMDAKSVRNMYSIIAVTNKHTANLHHVGYLYIYIYIYLCYIRIVLNGVYV